MTAPAAEGGADGAAPRPAGVTPPWLDDPEIADFAGSCNADPEPPKGLVEAVEQLFDAEPVLVEKEPQFKSDLQAMRDRVCFLAYAMADRLGPKSERNLHLAEMKEGWGIVTGLRMPGSFSVCEDVGLLQKVLDVAEKDWARMKDEPLWKERQRSQHAQGQPGLFGEEAA